MEEEPLRRSGLSCKLSEALRRSWPLGGHWCRACGSPAKVMHGRGAREPLPGAAVARSSVVLAVPGATVPMGGQALSHGKPEQWLPTLTPRGHLLFKSITLQTPALESAFSLTSRF